MKFIVKIETDDRALVGNPLRESELGNIVSNIQYRVRSGACSGQCYDHSGRHVGTWRLDWEESA